MYPNCVTLLSQNPFLNHHLHLGLGKIDPWPNCSLDHTRHCLHLIVPVLFLLWVILFLLLEFWIFVLAVLDALLFLWAVTLLTIFFIESTTIFSIFIFSFFFFPMKKPFLVFEELPPSIVWVLVVLKLAGSILPKFFGKVSAVNEFDKSLPLPFELD